MPSKRKNNTPSKRNTNARRGASSSEKLNRRQASVLEDDIDFVDPQKEAVKNDIQGVVVAVIAITMFISLISTSSAPVTLAIGNILKLGFGAGALLVPIALFLYAITFFMADDKPFSNHVAAGLSLIVIACLSILSLSCEALSQNPTAVLEEGVAMELGGYAGGIIAYGLNSLVGRTVGYVVLAGLIITGVIICGFTISGFVAKIRQKASEKSAEDMAAMVDAGFLDEDGLDDDYPFAPDPAEAAKTTFIGNRKTSVLKRDDEESVPTTLLDMTPKVEPKTTILEKKPSKKAKKETAANTPNPSEVEDSKPIQDKLPIPEAATVKIDKAPKNPSRPGEDLDGIKLPPLSILKSNPKSAQAASSKEELIATGQKLQSTLSEFGLKSRVVGYSTGPLVTTFKIEMGEGERVNKITNLEDDIQLSLASESIRIYAPIPGTSQVGIEIPNKKRQNVCLGDVLPYAQGGPLEFAVGRDSEGKPVIANLSKMPHLLIAGTTGSGKSVMINSIIMSMIMRSTPEQLRLVLVDPKRVEFSCYNGLPHLYVPVVTEPRQAASALQWAVSEMERRLKVFAKAEARDIRVYNKMCVSGKLSEMEHPPTPMPYLVVVIDELSDLMMVAGKDVEASIVRIAQLARAAGIHLIVATQRPSADVVTGLIKSNIDSRIALKVSSSIDSRVILDSNGAERLLGYGDMLFRYRGNQTKRILGCYTSDNEIQKTVEFISSQGEPDYHDEILSAVAPAKPGASTGPDECDPLMWDAAQIVVDTQVGSTSGLQRRLSVGYARAGRIMDMLEARGVVGPPDGSKPRDVLLDAEGLEDLRAAEEDFKGVE